MGEPQITSRWPPATAPRPLGFAAFSSMWMLSNKYCWLAPDVIIEGHYGQSLRLQKWGLCLTVFRGFHQPERTLLLIPSSYPRVALLLLLCSEKTLPKKTPIAANFQSGQMTDRQSRQTGGISHTQAALGKEKINVLTISSSQECTALRGGFRWYLGPSLWVHAPLVCL